MTLQRLRQVHGSVKLSQEYDISHHPLNQKSSRILSKLLQLCAMRLSVILLVLLAFMLQTFRQAEVIFGYHLNKSYITENFCVNKAKPEMQCNGKCHLKKELKESEEDASKNPVSLKQFNELFLLCDNSPARLNQPLSLVVAVLTPAFNFIYTDPCKDIFHPPRFSC